MLHNEIMKYVPEGMKKAIRKTDIDDNGYWIFFTDDYVVNTYGQDLKFYRMYKLTADNVAYCFEHIRKVSEAPEQEREEENTDDLTEDRKTEYYDDYHVRFFHSEMIIIQKALYYYGANNTLHNEDKLLFEYVSKLVNMAVLREYDSAVLHVDDDPSSDDELPF